MNPLAMVVSVVVRPKRLGSYDASGSASHGPDERPPTTWRGVLRALTLELAS
jgi:hypothetical protein